MTKADIHREGVTYVDAFLAVGTRGMATVLFIHPGRDCQHYYVQPTRASWSRLDDFIRRNNVALKPWRTTLGWSFTYTRPAAEEDLP